MAAGLGVLGFSPDEFWQLTVKEFEAAFRGHFGAEAGTAPLSRLELEKLMGRFPDFGVEA